MFTVLETVGNNHIFRNSKNIQHTFENGQHNYT